MKNVWLLLFASALFIAPASARTWVVAQAHPSADDQGEGTADRPFRSLAPAAARAQPGDTVQVHGGVYRERVAPARGGEAGRPVVYEAVVGEQVVLSGSDPLDGQWALEPDGLEAHTIAGLNYEGHWHPYKTALRRINDLTCGMIFVDGKRLAQARSRQEAATYPGTWWYDSEGERVLVHFAKGPRPELVEAAVRERVFAPHKRGLGHIVVRGFVIQHAAGQFPSGFWVDDERGYPQAGAIGTRSGHDWLIEHNIIRENSNIGMDIGVEGGRDTEGDRPMPEDYGRHVVRGNVFDQNGAGGIAGFRASAVVIEDNVITGTNWQGHTAPETGGVKLHFAYDAIVRRNHIYHNDTLGIWLDNVYEGARVERNYVHSNRRVGIFMEMGGGPGVVAWNVVVANGSDGIYMHDASDVLVTHNLVALNRQFGLHARTVTDRTWSDRNAGGARVLVGTFRVQVRNNVFIDNGGGEISLPFPSPTSGGNESDYNVFLLGTQWQLQTDPTRRWHMNLNDGKGGAVAPETRAEAWSALEPHAGETGYLKLDDWRAVIGHDRHSVAQVPGVHEIENGAVERGGFVFSGLGGWLRFARTAAINQLECPPVPEAGEVDYDGQPVASERVLPGPWQHLGDGEITVRTWPLRQP